MVFGVSSERCILRIFIKISLKSCNKTGPHAFVGLFRF